MSTDLNNQWEQTGGEVAVWTSQFLGSLISLCPSHTWKLLEASRVYLPQCKSSSGWLDRWFSFILPAVLERRTRRKKKISSTGLLNDVYTCKQLPLYMPSAMTKEKGKLNRNQVHVSYILLREPWQPQGIARQKHRNQVESSYILQREHWKAHIQQGRDR